MTMNREEKTHRLATAIRTMRAESDVESLALSRPGSFGETALESLEHDASPRTGIEKVLLNQEDRLDEVELLALEAIVMPQGRPVVFIRNGVFDDLAAPWIHVNDRTVRARIEPLFGAIGRVELPNDLMLPYAGTAFVVGPDLLMTNRHVARLFARGIGSQGLFYQAGDAAVHFRRHKDDPEDDRRTWCEVEDVRMIHPYWDMALLQVHGLPEIQPLRLAIERPEDMAGSDVAAVGYPARDARNDLALQDRIFVHTYGVKRFQPGKLRGRERIRSFEHVVPAVTHDSSTLGGNSGSAIVDLNTGLVVGLHFAGIYLKANYAVPSHELARDPRVVDAGVNFNGAVEATDDYDDAWARSDPDYESRPRPSGGGAPVTLSVRGDETATWTMPVQVSISIGQPRLGTADAAAAAVEAMKVPVIHPDIEDREGYQPDFLDGEVEVPLPTLTAAGKKVVSRLDDGTHELRYHHFSIVMHKGRRMALFTGANVDWRKGARTVNGRKPNRKQLTGLGDNDRERWVTDPRIPDAHQLPDIFYTKDRGSFDKGHLVRRDDVCWGKSFKDIQKANGDTYHTTNCSPQIAGFNQASRGEDNWGDLENLVQQQTKAECVCVFCGPVLEDEDREFRGRDLRGETRVRIPRRYWKVIVARDDDGPGAYGFMLEQDLSDVDLEMTLPAKWRRQMVPVSEIEEALSGLVELSWLKSHDRFDSDEGTAMAEVVRT